ncbi:heat-inducible transcriptional repressor HrcA [Rarobacter faecitabidus]|uniref:Heat-inducible transcription repressor HrcA n=1 Tax=Rarobacter faecitabidus TaxID=13243 RepID=A0A542ZVG4_RARFA|nr:heat-inducible transcriptional repressor HrcA [Rarobacter faecitabidus]TQL64170.1 heat-inducible transcription repressor HrcA [Rarobacter faecitabidus]
MSDGQQRSSTQDRRASVLRAVIEHYVATREPVGSKSVAESYHLGVSSATIRNDMAILEDEGYIAQPHTSAGRIPTDKGYRLFVDRLATVKPMSASERRAVETFIGGGVDLDDVILRASQLLAQLTGQLAVVQYPSLRHSGLRHLELVQLDERAVLVVIITDTGRVEQRRVTLDLTVDEASLGELRARLNKAADGRRVGDLGEAFDTAVAQTAPEYSAIARRLADLVLDTLGEEREERIVTAGTANLVTPHMGFETSLGPMLEALEEQVVLLRLFHEMAADTTPVSVRIGSETQVDALAGASVVTSGYGNGPDLVATISAIGPTRMNYPATISAVRAIARYLSRIVAP